MNPQKWVFIQNLEIFPSFDFIMLNINFAHNFDPLRLFEVNGIFMLSLVRSRTCPERDTVGSAQRWAGTSESS